MLQFKNNNIRGLIEGHFSYLSTQQRNNCRFQITITIIAQTFVVANACNRRNKFLTSFIIQLFGKSKHTHYPTHLILPLEHLEHPHYKASIPEFDPVEPNRFCSQAPENYIYFAKYHFPFSVVYIFFLLYTWILKHVQTIVYCVVALLELIHLLSPQDLE